MFIPSDGEEIAAPIPGDLDTIECSKDIAVRHVQLRCAR
jgi:hypothetical protein